MPDWLEIELAEALRPAEAPPELWDRVWAPRWQPRPGSSVWTVWPVAAAIALAVLAGAAWFASGKEVPADLRLLAVAQLRDTTPLDFRSSDPAEVSRWLHRHTGADVRLPAAGAARVLGTRLVRMGSTAIGAVVYRVGDREATLLVAKGGRAADTPHGRFSWQARGVSFALACSDEGHPEAACLLCHAKL